MAPFRRSRKADSTEAAMAAREVSLTDADDQRYLARVLNVSKRLGKDPWDWYAKLGEINYAVRRMSRLAGYAKLGVYEVKADGSLRGPVTRGLQGDLADMLYSPYGGQRGLIERFVALMKVPGDSFLIRGRNGVDYDGMEFVSSAELRSNSVAALMDGKPMAVERITLPGGTQYGSDALEERIMPADFLGRVWRCSPQFIEMPDSPLVPLNTECKLLHLLTQGLEAKLRSRLASLGIVYIPNEVTKARSAAPTGKPGEFHQNAVLDELLRNAVFASRNPELPESAVPSFVVGPGDQSQNLRHIIMDQELYATDMATRSEMATRILTGLDLQPSKVTGEQDSNHWSAWSATDDEIRIAVQPDLEVMCWALTRIFLWREMLARGLSASTVKKYVIWYDLSNAVSHVNPSENARQLADRIMISPAATRRASGYTEADAPNEVEAIRMAGIKMGDPYLATYGMSEQANFDWDKIGSKKTGPNPDSPADDSTVQPGKGQPGSPSDNKSKTPARNRPA